MSWWQAALQELRRDGAQMNDIMCLVMSGLLEVHGSISLTQFWPVGSSDADTSKVEVTVGKHPFRFRPSGASKFRNVDELVGAVVRGKTRKAVVAKGMLVVRLQATDAPELHYRPSALVGKRDQTQEQRELYLEWNHEYRQPLAETATRKLAEMLAKYVEDDSVPCVVRSFGDQPSDFFDTYGRLVGEIWLPDDTSVNQWLLKRGWALPAFYNSMSRAEIASAIDLANSAYADDRGIWPWYSGSVTKFDSRLRYRSGDEAGADEGVVIVPKVFRRLATYKVAVKSKMFSGSFLSYLAAHPDACYLASEFMAQLGAAPERHLHEFIDSGELTLWPEDIVFKDSPSQVVDPSGNPLMW